MKWKLLRQIIVMSRYALIGCILQTVFHTVLLAETSYAQKSMEEMVLSVQVKEVRVLQALKVIERQIPLKYAYILSEVEQTRETLTLSYQQATLGEVLRDLSVQTGLRFKRINQTVHISRMGREVLQGVAIVEEMPPLQQRISGKVISSDDNQPLPGVSVLVKGTNSGTVTDINGAFAINAAEGAILQYSYIGYLTQELTIGSQTELNIVLRPDMNQLEEVVVIGYGAMNRKDLTGSISSISAEEVKQIPIVRPEQILQGRAAGVQVTQTSAEPGGVMSIRIRGTNSINSGNEPLFVIDGFPGAGNLNTINPNDIESIEILKDASATAIYGARGANGVVIITTKKGRAGKSQVDFEVYHGVQTIRNKLELMNATQYTTFLNEATANNNAFFNTNNPLPFDPAIIPTLGEGTDWQDEVYRTAPISNYQFSITGGTETMRYAFSANYFSEQGIMRNTGFQRGSMRFNIEKDISKKIKFGSTAFLTRSLNNRTRINTAGGSDEGIVYNTYSMSPTTPVIDTDGSFTLVNQPQPFVDLRSNPVAFLELAKSDVNDLRGLINSFGEVQILPSLSFRVNMGIDFNHGWNNAFTPSTVFIGSLTNGSASRSSSNNYSWLNENYLTYTKSFGTQHFLNVVGGFTMQEFRFESFTSSANNFFTNNLEYNNLGIAANILVSGTGASLSSLASGFVRANYRLKDRYYFTFTGRADGSSKFGESNKWGYFPSTAVKWRIIDEPFMGGLNSLSELSLRSSYVITGNQEIGSYQALSRYGQVGYNLGTSRVVGIVPNSIANNDLRWEKTSSFDLGMDIGLWSDRITLTVDYYYKKTTDLLLNVQLPRTSGFASAVQNIGSVDNRGLEISLFSENIKGDFTWTTNANFSTNRNRVLDLGGEQERFVGATSGHLQVGNSGILRIGQPIGSFFGYIFDGIYQTPEQVTEIGLMTAVAPVTRSTAISAGLMVNRIT
jgi:TonB-linked SusC/RagA family outer membrane protein